MSILAPGQRLAPGQQVETFRYWRMCAWAGPVFLFVFVVFWGLLGGNIPPIPADSPATVLATHYRDNANLIRIGMGMAMTFVVLYLVWGLSIAKVIERGIERGTGNNVLSTLVLWGAGLTVCPLLIGSAFWLTGSYRAESLDPSILQLFYDMPWLLINLADAVTTLQMIAMGVAFLKDKRETPLFPRWLSWTGIWVGVSFALELFLPYFKAGPFARQGVVNFWIEFFLERFGRRERIRRPRQDDAVAPGAERRKRSRGGEVGVADVGQRPAVTLAQLRAGPGAERAGPATAPVPSVASSWRRAPSPQV